MKPEKELSWIFILMTSPYVKRLFGNKIGCKKDFERLVKANENDKTFAGWIKELIKEGSLEYSGELIKGKIYKTDGYSVIPKRLMERLKKNEYYIYSYKFFENKSTLGLSI